MRRLIRHWSDWLFGITFSHPMNEAIKTDK
jgi:hypothetical protein